MTRTFGALLALTISLATVFTLALAQDTAAPEQSTEAPAPDVPRIEHAHLTRRAGEYTTTIKYRSAPDAEPEVSTGVATITSILDGRFISEDNSGTMGGAPFSGRRIMGFNNRTERFEASWFYSNSSAMLVLVGESNDLGSTIDLKGSYEGAPGKMFTLTARIRFIDFDRFAVDMLSNAPDGSQYVMLETLYKRVR